MINSRLQDSIEVVLCFVVGSACLLHLVCSSHLYELIGFSNLLKETIGLFCLLKETLLRISLGFVERRPGAGNVLAQVVGVLKHTTIAHLLQVPAAYVCLRLEKVWLAIGDSAITFTRPQISTALAIVS